MGKLGLVYGRRRVGLSVLVIGITTASLVLQWMNARKRASVNGETLE